MNTPQPGSHGPDKHPEFDDEIFEADEVIEHLFDEEEFIDERAPTGRPGPAQPGTSGTKTFLESIGETLKSAGETASRYTQLGVAHAELHKLRFDLRRAYGKLGDAAMRCWDHHPGIALTTDDPELKAVLAGVREARKNIRAKQAQIAELRRPA